MLFEAGKDLLQFLSFGVVLLIISLMAAEAEVRLAPHLYASHGRIHYRRPLSTMDYNQLIH